MTSRKSMFVSFVVAVACLALPVSNAHAVASKCDSKITKAAGKKASCKAGVYSKAYLKDTAPDAAKLTNCETKFDSACEKAKTIGDCVVQTQPCATVEDAVDICVADVVDNTCSNEGGFCWLLGEVNANCTDTCAAEGMVYDAATEAYAGSGGTDEECEAVLDSLGVPAGPVSAGECAVSAIACYYDSNENGRSRCTNAGAEGNAYVTAQRACACMAAP